MAVIDVDHLTELRQAVEAARQAGTLRITKEAYAQLRRTAVDQALDRAAAAAGDQVRKAAQRPEAPIDPSKNA